MSDRFVTIVVTAAKAPAARNMAAVVSGGSGMFEVGLSKTSKAPATHYISSGWVSEEIAALFPNAIQELPSEAMERLSLQLIEESL